MEKGERGGTKGRRGEEEEEMERKRRWRGRDGEEEERGRERSREREESGVGRKRDDREKKQQDHVQYLTCHHVICEIHLRGVWRREMLERNRPLPVRKAFGQGFAEIRVGAKVKWCLPFLILEIEICSVGGQKAGNRCTGRLLL